MNFMNTQFFIILIFTANATIPSNHTWLLLAEEQCNQQPALSQIPQLRTLAANTLLHRQPIDTLKARTMGHLHPIFDAILEDEKRAFETHLGSNTVTLAMVKQLYKSSTVPALVLNREAIIWKFLRCNPEERRKDDIEISKELIHHNPNLAQSIGVYNFYSIPPILFIAQNASYNQLLPTIIEANADLNVTDDMGRAVISVAAMNQNTNFIELLIAAKVAINKQDQSKQTVLHYAANSSHIPTVALLLLHGANFYTNIHDEAPLDKAEYALHWYQHVQPCAEKAQITRQIISLLLQQLPIKKRIKHKLKYPHR